MSLDLRKLEKRREVDGGFVQARCPACAEAGNDEAGEHLRIYPDGRYGCCVHPQDREHRKRIFALVGDKAPQSFTVKVAVNSSAAAAKSVTASLIGFVSPTGSTVLKAKTASSKVENPLGTPGTAILNPCTNGREDKDSIQTCKDIVTGVPSVLNQKDQRMPYLTPNGTLVIPFDCPARYHWWKDGQAVRATRDEVNHRH